MAIGPTILRPLLAARAAGFAPERDTTGLPLPASDFPLGSRDSGGDAAEAGMADRVERIAGDISDPDVPRRGRAGDGLSTVRVDALGRIARAGRAAGTTVVVISGPAGAGKTRLAQAALQDFAASRMLTGSGKYGEGDAQSALAPVMAALSALLAVAFARLYDPQTGIAALTDALGVDLEVLISAGLAAPGLPIATRLKALGDRRRGMTRIIAAALNLLRWTERFGVPRVLLIDDWRRAPPDGIDLVRAIADAPVGQPLVLLLTQREAANEQAIADRADWLFERLGPLDAQESEALFSASLDDPRQAAAVLTELRPAIPRLPFDIVQAAEAVARSGALCRSGDTWSIDRTRLGSLAFDPETRIARLNEATRRCAAAIALWGDSAPSLDLRVALDVAGGDAEAALVAEGIVKAENGRVAFLHDKLRRAAEAALSADERSRLSAEIAERLVRNPLDAESLLVALRLRLVAGLEEAAPNRWRDLFAAGATAARGRGDVDAAAAFAEAALTLRQRERSPAREADRAVLREAVLAAADRDDPVTEVRVAALIASGVTSADHYEDYELGAVALRLARRPDAAWRVASEGLRHAGIRPPAARLSLAFLGAAARWWIGQRTHADLSIAPGVAIPLDGFTGVAATAASIAYHRDPRAAAVIGYRASRIVGALSRRSAYWQSVDAFLFAALGARRCAADAGERALAGFGEQRVLRAATLYQALFFGVHWRRPLASQRDRFREVTRIALTEGDLITACYGLRIFIMSGWRTTASLDLLLEEAIAARAALQNLGEASFVEEMTAMVAMLEGLTGRAAWNPAAWRDDIPTRNHVIDLELSNLAGDWPGTLDRAARLRPLRRDYSVQADAIVMCFHETLARLKCGLAPRRGDLVFLGRAAALNPADHGAKLALLDAERLQRRGAPRSATLIAFGGAVDAAGRGDSRLDAAIAAVCASDHARSIGDDALARRYRERADAILAEWGARAIVPAAEALAEAQARAASAVRGDRAKSRLMAHVGHELRTPLQALQALLDLAAAEERSLDPHHVRAVLGSLIAVVDDLNIAGALGDDHAAGIAQAVDLGDLIRSEVMVWKAQATISIVADGSLPLVDVAADRVRQIVRNLLSNAVKYGAASAIVIDLAATPLAGDEVAVTISVRDSGPGLGHNVERLFDPFERGGFAGDGRGAGVGLALSRRYAERLGGTLNASNDPAGGARFTLALVAVRSANGSLPAAAAPAATILLVEDTAMVRRLLKAMLVGMGHRVIEAADAGQAIAAWRGGAFDIAIIDMGLPDASGLSVLATIRAGSGASAGLPVILLTASSAGEAEAAAHDDPAVRVLRKPASAETLNRAMAELRKTATPAAPSPAPGSAEIATLYAAARGEITRQARGCLEDTPDPRKLHQLAGLAAQFGWADLALAVERFEAAVAAGAPLATPRAGVTAALEGMA